MSYLNPTEQELDDFIQNHYGYCERDRSKEGLRNDCYWGKDSIGRNNGCLQTGGLGKSCPYWHPQETGEYLERIKSAELIQEADNDPNPDEVFGLLREIVDSIIKNELHS